MKITVLTLFKEMYDGFLNSSIIKRIIDKQLVEINIVDIRDYSNDKHRHVDDTPYGGGAGMLMKVDVVHRALLDNKSDEELLDDNDKEQFNYINQIVFFFKIFIIRA